MTPGKEFKGRQFTAEVILWAVRWYLRFPISYRDLALMLADRGVSVDHTTIYRWMAVSTRSATGAGVRLGRGGRGGQVLLEHLARGAVAEAAPRGVVEPLGAPAEAGVGERLGRALARQEAPGAAVQVLDAALPPRAVR